MVDKENKIRELFDLCIRISNETTSHISFDYTVKNDESVLYLFVFDESDEISKHFAISQFYDSEERRKVYRKAKECLQQILSKGRCLLDLEEELA